MSPVATFFAGVVLLFVFFAYLGTTGHDKKKLFGTLLTVLMSAFCAWAIWGNGIKPGIDIGGGSSFTVQLQKAKDDNGKERDITSDSIQQAIAILEKRLNDGTKDLIMAPQGKDKITLNMPGVSLDELAAVREKIQQVAHLEFRIVRENLRTGTGPVIGAVELPFKENADKKDRPQTIYVSQRADMEGKYVKIL